MGRPKAPCGTDAAYRRHLRNHEPVDDACREAHAAERRTSRRSPAAASQPTAPAATTSSTSSDAEVDDMKLIVDTLRTAFKTVAAADPTKLAPIAREFRTVVEATQGASNVPKEKSLAEQLAEVRAARAARASSKDTAS